jgi:tetratricopeptide (TPR) repeat protein
MSEWTLRVKFNALLLLAFLFIGLYLLAFVPLHLQALMLVGVLALMMFHRRLASDPDTCRANWLSAALIISTVSSAYAWTALYLPGPESLLVRGPLPLLIVMALALLRMKSGISKSGRIAGTLTASLAFLSVLVSILVLAWRHAGGDANVQAPLTIFGVLGPGGVDYLPSWLHARVPGEGTSQLALACWTLFIGMWFSLKIPTDSASMRVAQWPMWSRMWFALLTASVIYNAAWLLAASFWAIKPPINCAATGSEMKALVEAGRSYAEHARRQGAADVEKAVLMRGVGAGRCGFMVAESLPLAARLATLGSDNPQYLLLMADMIERLGQGDQAQELFSEQRLPDEKLALIVPTNEHEAWLLSEVWRSRNDLDHVRELLELFVKAPKPGDIAVLREEPYPLWVDILRRYGDYCIYSGRLDCAEWTADSILDVFPEDFHALMLKGEVAYEKDDIASALKHSYHALRLNPNAVRVVGDMIAIYVETGKLEAIYPLQRKVKIFFPERAWAGSQFSKLYLPGTAYLQGDLLPGRMHLEFFAKATPANGEWPIMEIWVNGVKVGQATVDSDQPKQYPFEFTSRRGPNRIEVRYVNDAGSGKKEDRNLRIGPGFLEPVYYEGQKRQ